MSRLMPWRRGPSSHPVVRGVLRSAAAVECSSLKSEPGDNSRAAAASTTAGQQGLHVRTPLIHSRKLSRIAGRPVLLKLDNLQPVGSFKIRGIGHTCQTASETGVRHLVGSSAGNAGVAMAYAAEKLGIRLSLFIPETSKKEMVNLLKTFGTTSLTMKGRNWDAANEEAQKLLAADRTAFFVHPFNQETTWTGHATIVQEISEQMRSSDGGGGGAVKPAAVVTSVGGGGLAIGIILGMRDVGWSDVPVVAMETKGCDCLSLSLDQGRRVVLDEITSIATSLGAKAVDPKLLELAAERPFNSRVVSDDDALGACYRFADDHRMLVEPACGAALCAAYKYNDLNLSQAVRGEENRPMVVIVCGGNLASFELFEDWRRQLGANMK